MIGWYHLLDGHEFEQAPGVGDGQESLACCSPWGQKESDTTDRMNWTEWIHNQVSSMSFHNLITYFFLGLNSIPLFEWTTVYPLTYWRTSQLCDMCFNTPFRWFPSGSMLKNMPANAGDVGSISGSRRFPGGGQWQPTPVFLAGKSHGQKSLVGYSL